MRNQGRRFFSVAAVLVICAGSLASAAGPPQISAGGIVNAASFQPPLARCGLASLFGTNLADTQAWAALVPLPTTLGGAQVLVNGAAAPLIYASPSQINFQVPCEAPLNGAVGIYVTNSSGMSSAQAPTIAPYAPGVFTYARTATATDPVIVHVDNSLVTPDKPANPGEILIVYATGVGNLNHMPVTGAASPASPLSQAVDLPTVTVGGAAASASFAGLTPGLVGLMQINIQLPSTYPAGSSLPLVVCSPEQPARRSISRCRAAAARLRSCWSPTASTARTPPPARSAKPTWPGGSGSHYYVPLFAANSTFGVSIGSGALQSNNTDYSGVQLSASSDGCGRATGEGLGTGSRHQAGSAAARKFGRNGSGRTLFPQHVVPIGRRNLQRERLLGVSDQQRRSAGPADWT